MDESKEAGGELVIANGDSAELLELEEEGFHKVTLLVKPPIYIPRIRFITLGRDAEISSVGGNILPQFPFSVGFVSQYSHARPQLYSFQHFLSDLHVMHVSG